MADMRFLFRAKYARSRALVIGIDKYVNAPNLAHAVSDAKGIATALVSELSFLPDDITVLLNEEATRNAITEAFMRFSQDDIEVDERLIVFFAGHGHTLQGYRGETGYLVPHDADMKNLSSLLRWDELTRNSELIRAKHVFFIMDACYGGLALIRGLTPGSSRFVHDMMVRYSRQVLTAGKGDEVVADAGGPLPGHSLFTGYLLQGLSGAAATPEGVITAAGLMAYVYSHVANDKNSNQTPHFGHFDGDGDIVLKLPPQPLGSETETSGTDLLMSIPYPSSKDPVVVKDKVKHVKRLLSSSDTAIELHDLAVTEVRSFLSKSTDDSFRMQGSYSDKELLERLTLYEVIGSDLSTLTACLAYWGKAEHLSVLQKITSRSADRLEIEGGLDIWLALRWYPLIVNFYCAGVAVVEAARYDSLVALFYSPLSPSAHARKGRYFVHAVADAMANVHDAFRKVPGYERKYTPTSEYLFKLLQPRLDDVFFIGKQYETAFDEFEVLFALVACDLNILDGERAWGPVGRFAWKGRHSGGSPLNVFLEKAQAMGASWAPLKAGLFGGEKGRFDKAAQEFSELLKGFRY